MRTRKAIIMILILVFVAASFAACGEVEQKPRMNH